ncbi:MAG TPA: tetratricopeptide repeat protein [Vicinamibacterales bacterium]
MRFARPLSVLGAVVFAASVTACSKSADYYMAQGKDLYVKKDYKGAAIDFRNAIAKQPRLGEAHEQLADTYIALGNYPAGIKEYARAADLRPDDAALQVRTGQYLLLAGKYQDAKGRADAVLQKDPSNVDARLLQARAMFGLNDLDGAISQVEQMLTKTTTGDAPAYANLGTFQLAKGNAADAEVSFKKAVSAQPTSINARLSLAGFYWNTDRLGDAEATLNDAVKIEPGNVLVNRMLAIVLIRANKPAEAEAPLKIVADRSNNPNAKFILASYYLESGREKDATALLTSLTGNSDTYAPATLDLARIALGHHDLPRAHQLVDQVLAKDPKNANALVARTGLLAADGKFDQALEAAKAAVAADGRSADAEFALGELYASRGDVDHAIDALNLGLKLSPRALAPKARLASLYLSKGDASTAVDLARQATKGPHALGAELVLVRALIAHNDVDAAAQELAPIAHAYPNLASVLIVEGNLAWKRNDAKGAREAFAAALKASPANGEAVRGLIAAAVALKDVRGAEAIAEDALAKTPKDGQLQFVLGNLKNMHGDTAGAEAAYKNAIAISPSLLEAYQALGAVYVQQKRLPDALTEFERAADQSPNSVSAQTATAVLFEMQNKPDEARKRYEKALQIDPRAAVAANNLAWMDTADGGNLDVALQLAQTAKSQLPNAPEVDDTLGWIYVKKGLPGLAIPSLEDCIRKDPGNVEYLFHLGMAYAKLGDKSKARDALNRAIASGTPFDGIDEARQTVNQLKG